MSYANLVAKKFTLACRERGYFRTSVVINGEGLGASIHVTNPPDGFDERGLDVTTFIERATDFIEKVGTENK